MWSWNNEAKILRTWQSDLQIWKSGNNIFNQQATSKGSIWEKTSVTNNLKLLSALAKTKCCPTIWALQHLNILWKNPSQLNYEKLIAMQFNS